MSAAAAPARPRLRALMFWVFILVMVVLTGVFAVLGNWQLQRLKEKEALVATIAERMNLDPQPLPPVAEWVGFDAEVFDYRPVTVTGTFVPEQSVLVFTSLSDPNGSVGGPGYWVMTPFRLEEGGIVWLNRGFVPQQQAPAFATGGSAPAESVTLTGIARAPEQANGFTPGADARKRIDYVRDPVRLSAMADPALTPVAPIYVDLPAGDPGALPQGGETEVSFPNNHLGYAFTWFGFALLTPILLIVWVVRQRRP